MFCSLQMKRKKKPEPERISVREMNDIIINSVIQKYKKNKNPSKKRDFYLSITLYS